MISKKAAFTIAENYLADQKRRYTSIAQVDKIMFRKDDKVLYGKYEEQLKDVYVVEYGAMVGFEERSNFIYISGDSGEVLYSISSHGWIERPR